MQYSAAWLEIKCSSSSTSRIEIIHLPPPEEFLTRGGLKWNLLDHLCKHRWRHVAKNNQFFCPGYHALPRGNQPTKRILS